MSKEAENKVTTINRNHIKRIIISLICTIFAVFVTFCGIFALFMKLFSNHSPEAQDIYLIISFFIITIFIIIFCTLTILDNLKNG